LNTELQKLEQSGSTWDAAGINEAIDEGLQRARSLNDQLQHLRDRIQEALTIVTDSCARN
jgi:hypothetical protein